jgi:hypothetical protein
VVPVKKTKSQVKVSKKLIGMKVTYKDRDWELKDLLEFMALRIKELEKHQCKPKANCLFEGQQYLDRKYTPNEAPTEFWYYG